MELCDQDARSLRCKIEAKKVRVVDLVESCINRIETENPRVNAVVTTNFVRARQEAEIADKAIANGDAVGPLHGIPFLVKDLADTEGLRTTYGSLCFKDNVPDKDATIVARMRAAGAICLGKTNTPEFGAGANTTNALFGATSNPFNEKATCGGSSGGSAVALACGMAPLATGSDLGGSLRIPASFCGVVGMRPSSGLVPSNGHIMGFSPLWTDGPMARNVGDLSLMLSVIAGQDREDPMSFPIAEPERFAEIQPLDLGKVRFGVSADLGVATIDAAIEKLFTERMKNLETHVGSIENMSLDLSRARPTFRALRAESLFASFSDLANQFGDKLGANILSNLEEAQQLGLADVAHASAEQTILFRKFHNIFNEIDVLICPATAVSPFPLEQNAPDSINGEVPETYYDWYAITWALSLMGCPVVTVPCGTDHSGFPFGVQVVTPRHSDLYALEVASALEAALANIIQ